MKKQLSKITLKRDTIVHLSKTQAQAIAGGGNNTKSGSCSAGC